MDNLIIVTSKKVNRQELRGFVESWGGYWNDEPTLDQGVVERHGSIIYVSLCQDIDQDYEAHEINDFTARLGTTPGAYIDVHISHQGSSETLARDFAQSAIAKWKGLCISESLST